MIFHNANDCSWKTSLGICSLHVDDVYVKWICNLSVGSPTSATKPIGRDSQAMGATSGSSHDQSDDDDLDTETGPCEQSTDNIDVKRIKR